MNLSIPQLARIIVALSPWSTSFAGNYVFRNSPFQIGQTGEDRCFLLILAARGVFEIPSAALLENIRA
jgi:hypothetical protein